MAIRRTVPRLKFHVLFVAIGRRWIGVRPNARYDALLASPSRIELRPALAHGVPAELAPRPRVNRGSPDAPGRPLHIDAMGRAAMNSLDGFWLARWLSAPNRGPRLSCRKVAVSREHRLASRRA
jgi:hypothetical protein